MGKVRWIALALCGIGAPAAAAEPWREASSSHFVIYAQYTTEALQSFANQLERFDKALRVLRHLPDAPVGKANRLTIFVVQDNAAAAKLAGAPRSDIVGFYRGRAGASVAIMSREKADHWADATPQIILLHEYAHHFMYRNYPAAYPGWYSEGFAEFFSTALFDADGGIEIGAPANHRAYEFAIWRHPNIPLMVSDPSNGAGLSEIELYGYGWLLTHYLTFNDARKGQLTAYLDAINRGRPAREAAIQAFGDLLRLQREALTYLSKRHMKVVRLLPAELPTGPVALRELAPGEAEMLPTKIRAFSADTGSKDTDLVNDARRVAAHWPQDLTVASSLAETELAGGDLTAANTDADRVLTADANALPELLVKAEVALRLAAASGSTTEKARLAKLARAFALRANRIDPDHPVPLILFYRSFAAAGETPSANAVTGLTRAHLLAPEDADLRLLLATEMIAESKAREARILLTPIAYASHGGAVRKAASALLAKLPAGSDPAPTPER